jgi:hypothetical protein
MTRRSEFKEELTEFHKRCILLANCAQVKADLFFYFNHLCSLLIIFLSLGIGITGLLNSCTNLIGGIMGFVITAIKTGMSIYSPEKKCVQMKMISQQLRKIATNVRKLTTLHIDMDSLEQKYEMYLNEFNNIDLGMYDVGTQSKIITMLTRSMDQGNETDAA